MIREADLERTLDDKVHVGPAVATVEELGEVHSEQTEDDAGETFQREHKLERGEEDKENKCERDAARRELEARAPEISASMDDVRLPDSQAS